MPEACSSHDASEGPVSGEADCRHEQTVAVVLAGGLARRMGGGDKTLRLLGGRPLLAHVLERVAPQVAAVALNANGDAARFAEFGLPVLADTVADYPGPLAGVLAGMDWAAARGMDWLVSVPGDCPFLPRDLVARLHAARQAAGTPFAVAQSGGWAHPVVGLWHVAQREALAAALAAGERKIDRFTAKVGCAGAQWPVAPVDPFFNANAPEDLAVAEGLVGIA